MNLTSAKHQPNLNDPCYAIEDSDTSGNYLHVQAPVLNKVLIHDDLTTIIPDDITIKAYHKVTLDIPSLPLEARTCCIYPHLDKSLLSTAAMCNSGGTTLFTKTEVIIK